MPLSRDRECARLSQRLLPCLARVCLALRRRARLGVAMVQAQPQVAMPALVLSAVLRRRPIEKRKGNGWPAKSFKPGRGPFVLAQGGSAMLAREMPDEHREILLLQRLTKGLLMKRGVV